MLNEITNLGVSLSSTQEIDIIRIISKICSIFSITGSFTIFVLFWFFKENRSFNLEMVVWYCLSNTLYLCSILFIPFNPIEEDNWCAVQSFTLTWFQFARDFWTCIIGYVAFISVIKMNHIENNKCMYRGLFLFLSFGISGGLASIILFTDTWGRSGGWCWLDIYKSDRPIVYKLVLFYFCLEWFFIILNLFFIYKVIAILKDNINNRNKELMKIYSVMKWYPIIQIICSLPASINRFYDIITKENNFGLMIAQSFFDCTEGCLITIVFLCSPQIQHSLRICCRKIFRRRRKSSVLDSNVVSNRNWANSVPTSEYTVNSDTEIDKSQSLISKRKEKENFL